jgi:hypothetical protein
MNQPRKSSLSRVEGETQIAAAAAPFRGRPRSRSDHYRTPRPPPQVNFHNAPTTVHRFSVLEWKPSISTKGVPHPWRSFIATWVGKHEPKSPRRLISLVREAPASVLKKSSLTYYLFVI